MRRASLSRFLDALAFFTCLVPARMHSGSALPSLLPWFGPAGLVLGAACTGAALLLSLHLSGSAVPSLLQTMLAGFAWLASEMLLSRALHWDGLCDVADALGSFRTGDAFWEVMKDSRIGAFGATALVAVFAGQLLGASAQAATGNWLVLALAPAWSRCQAALAFGVVAPRNPASLGGRFAAGPTAGARNLALLQLGLMALCLPAVGLPWRSAFAACLGQACVLAWIVRTASRHGGLNGDFAGASIELSQMAFLLAAC
ncbi:MAG: adenosylcobinamide-GDP ribazoletransferase [Desulfovibrio sp.]|jgi:adenosylcobinamide-GDP ribazoletransferase|nr:adenosylcobinamide-GDP ribazoletransferase [Desulfovibrio sp.]MBQ2516382.1 adenosylcobinamide-GDP ribazoletransferase [Desulfovibrio sp.]MCR5169801.1 adenosylcobinamide-GDP ribazoletransferase [Desulfovibrio sp.]